MTKLKCHFKLCHFRGDDVIQTNDKYKEFLIEKKYLLEAEAELKDIKLCIEHYAKVHYESCIKIAKNLPIQKQNKINDYIKIFKINEYESSNLKPSFDDKRERMIEFFHEKQEFFYLKDIENLCSVEKSITINTIKEVLQILG